MNMCEIVKANLPTCYDIASVSQAVVYLYKLGDDCALEPSLDPENGTDVCVDSLLICIRLFHEKERGVRGGKRGAE